MFKILAGYNVTPTKSLALGAARRWSKGRSERVGGVEEEEEGEVLAPDWSRLSDEDGHGQSISGR